MRIHIPGFSAAFSAASLVCCLAIATIGAGTRASAADVLTIGSKAPALDIEHWVQNGNGKFKEVTKFQSGKVYVVEFWATWCGPCISSMPHLAELQKTYASKGVQIISISDEDLDTVEGFLDRKLRGAKVEEESADPKTYRDLTSVYCLTTDPDQSTYNDYMRAAEQGGIPTAFIVGKQGLIEWIGHPMTMDEPLEQIVADKWDRAAYLKELEAQKAAEKAMQEVFTLLNEMEFDEALKKLDAVLKNSPDLQLQVLKLQVLVAAEKADDAAKHLKQVFASVSDPQATDMVAWNVYQMAVEERLPGKAFAESAVAAAKAALPKAQDKVIRASLMDTLAHLLENLGQIDEAIEYETKAIPLADPNVVDAMKDYLKELKKSKEGDK